MIKESKNKNGITLIALVITIIVMLILVSVTISMAINGGLFEKAGEAVGKTQNAINAEQQLANGKIKIGDKWYASIDDYLNNNPIKTGIVIDNKTLTLKKKETADVEGTEVLEGTLTASVSGMESEPEITWEVTPEDQTAIRLSGTAGKTITVTAIGTASAKIKVKAKCTYEGREYSDECEVELEILKLPSLRKGAFVEYGVAYKDMYISKDYSSRNGWRLVDYTDNGDGTISNVKIMSTGIPAKLYYWYNDTTNSTWYVKDETELTKFKEILGGTEYTFYTGAGTYYGLQASAGMYNNFKDILFAYGTENRGMSLGWFDTITVGGTTYGASKTDEVKGLNLFKAREDVRTIRLLTLKELNEALGRTDIDSTGTISDSTGLYRLDQLKNISGMSEYSYSSRDYYWLASPCPNANNDGFMCYVYSSGYVSSGSYGGFNGVRPLVCLNSGVKYRVGIETDSVTKIDYLTLTAE